MTVVSGDFEWDSEKAETNVRKYGVSFEEAETVFDDPQAVHLDDPSCDKRMWTIGFSMRARMLLVVHCEARSGDRTRIIARGRQRGMRKGSTERAGEESDGTDVDVRKLRVRGRGLMVGRRHSIRLLREAAGMTQVDIARRMAMDQSQISKIEAGSDHLVTTLRRYAEALGGELDVAIVLGGRRYRIGFVAGDAERAEPTDPHRLECAEPARARSTRAKLRDARPRTSR